MKNFLGGLIVGAGLLISYELVAPGFGLPSLLDWLRSLKQQQTTVRHGP